MKVLLPHQISLPITKQILMIMLLLPVKDFCIRYISSLQAHTCIFFPLRHIQGSGTPSMVAAGGRRNMRTHIQLGDQTVSCIVGCILQCGCEKVNTGFKKKKKNVSTQHFIISKPFIKQLLIENSHLIFITFFKFQDIR